MPKATEAKGVHFREGLLGGPVLKGDAISGDEDAGAVFAKFAMDKDFLRRGFAEEREELRELCGRRIGDTADGDVHKMQAEGFCAKALAFAGLRRFGADVDDGGDAESLELRKRGKRGLGAAKKLIGDLSGIVNAIEGDFLGERRQRKHRLGRSRESED